MLFKENSRKRLSKKTLWLIVLICFILGILSISLINRINNPSILLGFAVVLFFVMTIFLQIAMARTFGYKAKKPKRIVHKYNVSNFDSIEENLKKDSFTLRKASYGLVYSKIVDKTFYKVTLIFDSENYFDNTKGEELKPTKGIEKCTKMIGFELFRDASEKIIQRTPDFSIQTDNLLYDGFYYDEKLNMIVHPNVTLIDDKHVNDYNFLMNTLGLTDLVGDDNEV